MAEYFIQYRVKKSVEPEVDHESEEEQEVELTPKRLRREFQVAEPQPAKRSVWQPVTRQWVGTSSSPPSDLDLDVLEEDC